MEKQKFYEMRSSVQREGLEDMISWINNNTPTKDLVLLEIGSYVGESTVMFAENFKQVISIDPFVDNYDQPIYLVRMHHLMKFMKNF